MEQATRAALAFSGKSRTLAAEDQIRLTSVGIDIGSSTSHVVFSRIVMERGTTRYLLKSRETLFESPLLLTPYVEGRDIDAKALRAFIDAQYRRAGLRPADVDAGALILTGVAARRANARSIGTALAAATGRLVALSAGDALEATLVAHGSGAARLSRDEGACTMAVDVGGGTSKIAVCKDGTIVDRTVVDVGARLVCFNAKGRITAVEPAGRRLAAEAGVEVEIGAELTASVQALLAERLADRLFQAMAALPAARHADEWLRMPALRHRSRPDIVLFSGGVAEYLHGRESRPCGDLGLALAAAIEHRAARWGVPLRKPVHGIRATVIGASQYTVQLSGSTVFVAPEDALPLRNVMAVRPRLELDDDIDRGSVAAAVMAAVGPLGALDAGHPVALCLDWRGSATFERLDAVCRGIIDGLAAALRRNAPLVIVTDADVGGLIGMHCRQQCGIANAVVSIDGIELGDLDFIDIGQLVDSAGAVPVVVKSLLF